MASDASLFPPRPPGLPENLAAPTWAYRLRVAAVLVSLLLFVLVYLGLMMGAAYLVFWAATGAGLEPSSFTLVVCGALALAGILVFLFLLKGLFRRPAAADPLTVEVTEAEEPVLFEFLHRLCAETRAPLPHRVFLSPEVNAYVTYSRSVLGLVWPVRKDLTLGLGLVNVLDLVELKAVLAHEFGHFSQRSLKLGSYVYVCNQVLNDVVYGRDWFDHLLARAEHPALRVAPLVAAFGGVLWCLRALLGGLFRVLSFGHAELSRQMELNADLVAVSVTGSDAIVAALAKMEGADEALARAEDDLRGAAGRRLFTRDLFYHQTRAADDLRAEPDEPPPHEDAAPDALASHPTNAQRARNARQRHYPSPSDGRSPWLLFRDPRAVRERVTSRYYRARGLPGPGAALSSPEDVQRQLDEERAEATFDPRYLGVYDERWLEPGAFTALQVFITTLEPWDAERLQQARDRLYGDAHRPTTETYRRRLDECHTLESFARGDRTPRDGWIEFRGRRYPLGEAGALLHKLEGELDEDRRTLAQLDRDVFQVHAHLAVRLRGPAQELLTRYEFQLHLQDFLKAVAAEQERLDEVRRFLGENSRLLDEDYERVLGQLQESHETWRRHLLAAEAIFTPALTNVPTGTPLRGLLAPGSVVGEPGRELSWAWIDEYLLQLDEVYDRGRRLHFKSLSGLLAFQERISREWRGGEPASRGSVPQDAGMHS